jgi:dethiobiotin synthetase
MLPTGNGYRRKPGYRIPIFDRKPTGSSFPSLPEVESPDHLIIEGAGGIMVPLNEGCLMRDLMKKTDSQIILVTRTSLGTINHTLLSLAELERQDLRVMAVVMNGPKDTVSKQAIEYYGKVRVLAEIEPLPDINPVSLKTMFDKYFSVMSG